MAVNEIHLGDIGTIFEVTLKDDSGLVDLTGATTTELYFKKPGNKTLTKTAIPDGDPTTGILRYTTIADDLDTVGWWKIQAYIVLPGGSWKSDIGTFEVHGNII